MLSAASHDHDVGYMVATQSLTHADSSAKPKSETMTNNDKRDLNRDPITGAPGAHPVGVGVGGVGGAVAGAMVGALGGPIGMLVGSGLGAIAGAAAGKGVAERIDPTAEAQYWQEEHTRRPYYDPKYNYDNDYAPAYSYGVEARSRLGDRPWDERTDAELEREWAAARGASTLEWQDARAVVQDSWTRADRTYRTYDATDRYHESEFGQVPYRDANAEFSDYRPAYRFGVQARSQYGDRDWDDKLESELGQRWQNVKGESRLGWDKAKAATKDAWHSVERALPGDVDKDGR